MRKIFGLLLTLFALPSLADIAFTVAATPQGNGGNTTLSTTINPTGSNRAVLIAVYGDGQTVAPTVTYGGLTPTLVQTGLGSGVAVLWVYQILPASTGSQTIDVTFAATSPRNALAAIAYSGVDQTTPIGTAITLTDASPGTTHTITPTTVVGQTVVDIQMAPTTNLTVDGTQTARVDFDDLAGTFRSLGMSDKLATTTSTAMTWTSADSGRSTMIAVPLNAATGGGASAVPVIYQHLRNNGKR
jgi:hypothetical protein